MRTLMIIDDDPDDVQIFCEAIHEVDKKIRCLTSGSAEEGLLFLKNAMIKPEYIFLDLNMPRMNGKQCLEQLKKNAQFSEIPVIIYTTSKIKKDADDTMHLGASLFLTKPNKFEDLVNALKNILEKKIKRENFGRNLYRQSN